MPTGTAAVTLKLEQATSFANFAADVTGTAAAALKHLNAAGTGAQAALVSGTAAVSLKHLTASSAGSQLAPVTGTGAIVLPRLRTAGLQGRVNVFGTLIDATGAMLPFGTATFTLSNLQGQIPIVGEITVLGGGRITRIADANGFVSTSLWANYVILPTGTHYEVTITDQTGQFQRSCAFQILDDSAVNLNTLTCMSL